MEPSYQGRDYWLICKRFNAFKRQNPGIRSAALNDMRKLYQSCPSDAVKRRITTFIFHNQQQSPGNNGGSGGPRRA